MAVGAAATGRWVGGDDAASGVAELRAAHFDNGMGFDGAIAGVKGEFGGARFEVGERWGMGWDRTAFVRQVLLWASVAVCVLSSR